MRSVNGQNRLQPDQTQHQRDQAECNDSAERDHGPALRGDWIGRRKCYGVHQPSGEQRHEDIRRCHADQAAGNHEQPHRLIAPVTEDERKHRTKGGWFFVTSESHGMFRLRRRKPTPKNMDDAAATPRAIVT